MIVVYARTSSLAQVAGLEAQERDLRAAGCEKIFQEQVSSVAERQQLDQALDYVREGDQFVVTKLDRLARSVGDLLAIVARLEGKKASLRVLSISGNQPLDTGTSTGRLMLAVIGAVGQAEREAMLERQREGIAKAKREGRYKGRVPNARRQAAEVARLKAEGVRPSEIASRLGIGRASVYRVLGAGTDGVQRRCDGPYDPAASSRISAARTSEVGKIKICEPIVAYSAATPTGVTRSARSSPHACTTICHPPHRPSPPMVAATITSGQPVPVPKTPIAANVTARLPAASLREQIQAERMFASPIRKR
jgi:DNA invertase Pin-like site-specific DNA recombinase